MRFLQINKTLYLLYFDRIIGLICLKDRFSLKAKMALSFVIFIIGFSRHIITLSLFFCDDILSSFEGCFESFFKALPFFGSLGL